MIGFCPLASGSKGNSLYLGGKATRILIDAGISASSLIKRLRSIEVDPASIEAIFITHEHSDHIRGLFAFLEKYPVSIIANIETAKAIARQMKSKPRFKIFTTEESFVFGDFSVHPFSVSHDTLDPVGFTFKVGDIKIGICTDTGHINSSMKKHLEGCNYLYLEANHEPSLVYASKRPPILKKRILGKQGHLSNEDCAYAIAHVMHEGLKHVHLAHLSNECNAEEIAIREVRRRLEEKKIDVELSIAFQDRVSKPILF